MQIRNILIDAINLQNLYQHHQSIINLYSIDQKFNDLQYDLMLTQAFNAVRYVKNTLCIGSPNCKKNRERTSGFSKNAHKKMKEEFSVLVTNPSFHLVDQFQSIAPSMIILAQLAKKI